MLIGWIGERWSRWLSPGRRPAGANRSPAVGGHPALADQLGQVGPDRQLGRRVQRRVDGGVDPGDDLGRGAVAGGQGGEHLGLAVEAVGQVALDPGDGVGDQRPVARVEPLGPELQQQLQRGQVGNHVAARPLDHGGAAAEHMVPGEDGLVGGELEAAVVGGVPRRRQRPQLQPGRDHRVAGGQVGGVRAGPARRERGQRRPGPPGERPRPFRMVDMGVGEQHQLHPAPLTGPDHRRGVPLVVRPRVDHHRRCRPWLPDHEGVGPLERERRRVRRQHPGHPRAPGLGHGATGGRSSRPVWPPGPPGPPGSRRGVGTG